MSPCVAERQLLFCPKEGGPRKPFTVRVFAPSELKTGEVDFEFSPGTARCIVELDGLPGFNVGPVYGADTLQALQLAADIEPLMRRISRQYDLFYPTGEGYFDE